MTKPSGSLRSDERTLAMRNDILLQFMSNLMTDGERAALYGLPDGCRMRENAKIYSPDKFTCGEQVWIGEDAKLDASGGLSIGSFTSIGAGTYVWTHASLLTNILQSNEPGSPLIRRAPTTIGTGCYLPGPTVVMPGVTIGDCVVCLPMSVITRDVPSFMLVGGNPAKVIRKIDAGFVSELLDDLPFDHETKGKYLEIFAEIEGKHR